MSPVSPWPAPSPTSPNPLPPPAAPSGAPSPWRRYRQHFEGNQRRPLPPVPSWAGVGGEPAARLDGRAAAMARVLARFQLGEAGEGRVAREIRLVQLPGIDDDYRRALELFVAEEGRHARILAVLVRSLGGRLLRHGASDRLFRGCRRLLGLRFKLLTLLVAEVVGGELYAALAPLDCGAPLRAALHEIAADERHHLDFHADFLSGQARTPLGRLAGLAALWVVGLGALAVVLLENRRDLASLGLARMALGARVLTTLRLAGRAAFGRGRPRRVSAPAAEAGR